MAAGQQRIGIAIDARRIGGIDLDTDNPGDAVKFWQIAIARRRPDRGEIPARKCRLLPHFGGRFADTASADRLPTCLRVPITGAYAAARV